MYLLIASCFSAYHVSADFEYQGGLQPIEKNDVGSVQFGPPHSLTHHLYKVDCWEVCCFLCLNYFSLAPSLKKSVVAGI